MHLHTLLSNPNEQCLTFLPESGSYYLGYRFLEGEPLLIDPCLEHPGPVSTDQGDFPSLAAGRPTSSPSKAWKANWLTVYETPEPDADVYLGFRAFSDGSAFCKAIGNGTQREFYFQPVHDGVRVWLRFTAALDITASCCIQQCLRFTGRMNADWRQSVAFVPFLSELDMQAMGNPNGTLTLARRDAQWLRFPVPHTIYPLQTIPLVLPDLSSDKIDCGLIARETPDRSQAPASYFQKVAPGATWDQITAGLYWERTVLVGNRHPADCVHAWVDVGPLKAGQSRIIQGKIYLLEGTKEDLLEHWKRDFASA